MNMYVCRHCNEQHNKPLKHKCLPGLEHKLRALVEEMRKYSSPAEDYWADKLEALYKQSEG